MAEPAPESRTKADAILSAAQRLFTQFGFRRTSIDDIAREAGIAKGTVYLYFDGKEAVFRAMQARNLAEVEVACDAAEAAGGSFGDRLRWVLEALYAGIYDRYGQSEHLVELNSTRLAVGPDIAGQVDRTYTGRLVGFLEGAERAGEASLVASGLDAAAIAATLMAAAKGAKQSESGPPDPATYRASLARIAALIAAALRP